MGVDTDSARAHLCKKGGHIYGALLNICASQERKEIDSKLETGPALAGFGKTHEWSWIDWDQLRFVLTGSSANVEMVQEEGVYGTGDVNSLN